MNCSDVSCKAVQVYLRKSWQDSIFSLLLPSDSLLDDIVITTGRDLLGNGGRCPSAAALGAAAAAGVVIGYTIGVDGNDGRYHLCGKKNFTHRSHKH